jgi:2-dehydropantoate 2-reductase
MKFVIMGTGGVGGFFGGKLAKGGANVWFVARGAHLDAMRSSGLHIDSTEGSIVIPPGKMTDNFAEIGFADVVLFCVKSYDTESSAKQLSSILTKDSVIISLQNGVENEEKIEQIIRNGKVYGGVAFIYSTITAPGVVTETGGLKKIFFGERSGRNGEAAKRILKEMTDAGINAELTDDIHTALWKKFVFISSVGGLTALTRLTLGEILALRESRTLLTDAMQEVEAIAKLKGAAIEHNFVATTLETLKKFDNSTRSSLYYDLTNNKPLEIEALSGTVARYGHELGIPTPIHQTIYSALLPYHRKHLHQRSQSIG